MPPTPNRPGTKPATLKQQVQRPRSAPPPEPEEEDIEEELEEELDDEPEAPAPTRQGPVDFSKLGKVGSKPTATKTAKVANGEQDDPDWSGLLDRLQQGGSNSFLFAKNPKNRYRLLHLDGEPFFVEVKSDFRGKVKVKYMLLALDMAAELDERIPKGLIIAKTPFKAIVALLSEGYDLFSENGYGVTILKSGTGLDTSYSVMPSPKAIPVDPDLLDGAPTFEYLLKEYEAMAARRAEKPEGDAEEKTEGNDW